MKIALILLAGGQGSRMGETVPKTFLPLQGKPVILHSYEVFQKILEISKIVVVCKKTYRYFFSANTEFANPGPRRQDSVQNALNQLPKDTDFVLIHDGARPLIHKKDILNLISLGVSEPAATLATPLQDTIKKVSSDNRILKTPSRDNLWISHTPQIIRYSLLIEGFAKSTVENLTVTDDISLIELLGYHPLIIPSHYPNIKLTYPKDFPLIEALLCINTN